MCLALVLVLSCCAEGEKAVQYRTPQFGRTVGGNLFLRTELGARVGDGRSLVRGGGGEGGVGELAFLLWRMEQEARFGTCLWMETVRCDTQLQ